MVLHKLPVEVMHADADVPGVWCAVRSQATPHARGELLLASVQLRRTSGADQSIRSRTVARSARRLVRRLATTPIRAGGSTAWRVTLGRETSMLVMLDRCAGR